MIDLIFSQNVNHHTLESSVQKLEACGIDLRYVNKSGGKRGYHHVVYPYNLPGEMAKVVKVGINPGFGLEYGLEVEQRNDALIKKYLGPYYTPGEIKISDDGNYCVVKQAIEGRPITPADVFVNHRFPKSTSTGNILRKNRGEPTDLGYQLKDLISLNAKMIANEQKSLDIVGRDGLLSIFEAMKKGNSVFLANVFVSKDRIHLIDDDLINFDSFLKREQPFYSRLKSEALFLASKAFLSHFFAINTEQS